MKKLSSRLVSALPLLFAASLFNEGCSAAVAPTTGSGGSTGATTGSGGDGGGGSNSCISAADCADLADACNSGACINGTCGRLEANEGAACEDGKACSLDDKCHAGVCVAGGFKFCPSTDSCHVGNCDLTVDMCVQVPGNDGGPCNDSNACTATGSCDAGSCLPGPMIDCSFLDGPCSVGVCDAQLGCKTMAVGDGSPCEDGLFCTINDVCSAGFCEGAPNPCAPPNNPCLIGTCNEGMGNCVAVPGNNGAACDDGSPCTAGEICNAGQCGSGAPANNGLACDDGDGCTAGTKCQGGLCAGAVSVIMACVDGDACCPPGCDADDDCSFKVMVIAPDDISGLMDVQSKLAATGAFKGVDIFDATNIMPTAAQLSPYKAILVYDNTPFLDSISMGDLLADYFDAGGQVVIAPGANCDSVQIEGRFVNEGYLVLAVGVVDQSFPADSLGQIFEPNSPLVAGVSTLSCPFSARCFVTPVPGATVVAQWGAGLPLIARGVVKGRKRVDLNLFPPSNDLGMDFWIGDGANILKNALLYK
ncbi:MAG: hypothetical protein ABI193_07750 [Minicystis sp.]